MTAVTLWSAPAKLNLFLQVTGRRPDGYHDLQTVFQLIDLVDDIHIKMRTDGLIERLAGPAEVPPEADLVVRAARALQDATGSRRGAFGVMEVWRTVAHLRRTMSRTTHQAGSISPLASDSRPDVVAAWWLLWRPSPATNQANHWLLVARLSYGRRPQWCPTALMAPLPTR